MKKCGIRILKAGVFILGFCILFLEFQKVLHYRWDGDMYTVNMLLKTQPEDSYDVLYFGTSELKTAVYPAAVFHYSGVTSYNCAVTNKSAMTAYYQLKYALRYQKPKVVCCDFAALYDDLSIADSETIYRKVVDTCPDRDLKWEMIREIKKQEPTQSALSFHFPLLRYHSMWNELTEDNFKKDYVYGKDHEEYKMGCLLADIVEKGEEYDVTPEIWEVEASGEVPSEISVKWYDRFIQLCHENDITVVAVYVPALIYAYEKESRWEATSAYLTSRGVDIIDLNNYEAAKNMGFKPAEDIMADNIHLTYMGALRTSLALGNALQQRYGLEDNRGGEAASQWEEYWNIFLEEFEVPIEFS